MRKKKKDHTPFLLKAIRWGFPKLEKIAPATAHRYANNLFFTPFRYTVPHKEQEFMSTAETFTVTVNGKNVQAYTWGKGPVVMLVHGWAGRAGQFRKFIPEIVKNNYRRFPFPIIIRILNGGGIKDNFIGFKKTQTIFRKRRFERF